MSLSATPSGPQVATHQAAVLILGGTAAYGLDLAPYRPLDDPASIDTPYGASPPIVFLQPDGAGAPVAFSSRHGHDRLQRSAAFLNHRALMWAARKLGAEVVFSWNGTGAIAAHLEVGDLVAPNDQRSCVSPRRPHGPARGPPGNARKCDSFPHLGCLRLYGRAAVGDDQ